MRIGPSGVRTLYMAAGTNIVAIVLGNIGPSGAVQTVDHYFWCFGPSGAVQTVDHYFW